MAGGKGDDFRPKHDACSQADRHEGEHERVGELRARELAVLREQVEQERRARSVAPSLPRQPLARRSRSLAFICLGRV